MRRMAIVCCALWLVAGAGCATAPQQPGATKPWYQLGSWKKAPAEPKELKVTDIRDMNRGAGAPGAAGGAAAGLPAGMAGGMPAGMPAGYPAAQQPGLPSAGMASASSGQQY